jgi:hypothetical protein
MKHSKALLTLCILSVLLLISGCAHVRYPWTHNVKHKTHKTNNHFHRSPVVQNPARFPANEPTSVMAGRPRPTNGPLPNEVKF